MRILSLSILIWFYVAAAQEEDDDDIDFRYPSCSICPGGQEPLLGDRVLPANTAGVLPFAMTCDQAQAMARSGSFSPATCAILRSRIFDNCVCRVVSTKAPSIQLPTSFPTSSPPTKAPVIISPPQVNNGTSLPFTWYPTVRPSSSPTVAATIRPSSAPTSTNAPVAALTTTTIYLRLDGITGPLDEEEQQAFQRACLIFLADRIPEANNNIVCELASRRRLQSASTDVQATISSENYSGDDFAQSVLDAFAEDGDDFLDELQDQSDFFDDATGVRASSSPLPRVVTPTPITGNTNTLDAGGISALIVGCGIATILIVGGAYLVSRPPTVPDGAVPVTSKRPSTQEQPGKALNDSNSQEIELGQDRRAKNDTIMVFSPTPPASAPEEEIDLPPEATNFAVETLVNSTITDQNESIIEIEDGSLNNASEIEGFSVNEAGDVATSSRKDDGSSSVSSSALSSLRQNMISRTVVAPPGKLGIVIDTTLEGPVVHKVNPKSPLQGLLFPGDIIVAVDDVDTRAMPASAITALMVRTSGVRRMLTVLSEDTPGA